MKKLSITVLVVLMTAMATPALAASASAAAGIDLVVNQVPVITTQPVGGQAYTGGGITFSVAATVNADGQPLAYQWYKDGTNPANAIADATTAALAKTNLLNADSGNYQVIVTSARGLPKISDMAHLSVYQKLTVLVEPRSYVIDVGGTLIETVEVLGEKPYTYQWYKDGKLPANVIAGANTAQYAIVNAQVAASGQYFCQIIDGVSQSIWTANDAGQVEVRPVGSPSPEFSFTHTAGNAATATVAVNMHGVSLSGQVQSPGLLPANASAVGIVIVVRDGVNDHVFHLTATTPPLPVDGNSQAFTLNAADAKTWDGDPYPANFATAGLKVLGGYIVNPGAVDLLVDVNKVLQTENGSTLSINGAYCLWIP